MEWGGVDHEWEKPSQASCPGGHSKSGQDVPPWGTLAARTTNSTSIVVGPLDENTSLVLAETPLEQCQKGGRGLNALGALYRCA